MADSIFTKIIKGEIPAHKIYEDGLTYAFLDINPTQPGHTLVVPKKQIEFIWDMDSQDYHALMAACQKIARHIREVLGVKYVGVKVIGEEVPHAHVHLIPFDEPAQFFERRPAVTLPDDAALAEMAKRLAV